MKKGMLRSVLVAFMLIVTVGLLGCNGGSPAQNPVVGTWAITGMSQDGVEITEEELAEVMGEEAITLSFNEDGTVTGSFIDESDGSSTTYELDGDKVYLDGDTSNYLVLDGDTMTADIDGTSMILSRQ